MSFFSVWWAEIWKQDLQEVNKVTRLFGKSIVCRTLWMLMGPVSILAVHIPHSCRTLENYQKGSHWTIICISKMFVAVWFKIKRLKIQKFLKYIHHNNVMLSLKRVIWLKPVHESFVSVYLMVIQLKNNGELS